MRKPSPSNRAMARSTAFQSGAALAGEMIPSVSPGERCLGRTSMIQSDFRFAALAREILSRARQAIELLSE